MRRCWLAALAMTVLGCSASQGVLPADTADPIDSDSSADPVGDPSAALPDDPAASPLHLDFVTTTGDDGKPCAGASVCVVFGPTIGGERELAVRLTRDAAPVAGMAITFSFEKDPKGLLALSSPSAVTGPDGVASVRLQSVEGKSCSSQQVFTTIEACVDRRAEGGCLWFAAHASGKAYALLMVGFAPYEGAFKAQLTNGQVLLFRQDASGRPRCADLAPGALPAPSVASPILASLTSVAVFPEVPEIEKDQRQKYTIVGLARNDAQETKASACDDERGIVECAAMTAVELTLSDL